MTETRFTSFILAAGHGTRMRSDMAKPLHKIGAKPMLGWVIETAHAAGSNAVCVVTAPHHNEIEAYLADTYPSVTATKQKEALGTGHAAQTALAAIGTHNQPILVLFGDTPLITAETCQRLAAEIRQGADVCVLGFETQMPTGYGRLVRDEHGNLNAIIEEADATDAQKTITLVNAGVMAFSSDMAETYLASLTNQNAQGEYYLTDMVAIAVANGKNVTAVTAQSDEVQGVNSRADLAKVEAALQHRLRDAAMAQGVTLQAPETIFLSSDTIFEKDCLIEPHVVIAPGCTIKQGAHIKAFSHLEGAVVGTNAVIGPYARLRPGATLSSNVKIGNFVEIKKATLEEGAKVNHLSYIGDATIGAHANIGAGTITCNYDGYDKFQTQIGKGAFIGSNTALVAPISVGDGAIIGAGSTITKDVVADDLSLTRAQQKTLPQGGAKFRARKTKS